MIVKLEYFPQLSPRHGGLLLPLLLKHLHPGGNLLKGLPDDEDDSSDIEGIFGDKIKDDNKYFSPCF